MIDPRISEYIETQVAAGYPRDSIEDALRQGGWSAQEIADAYQAYEAMHISSVAETSAPAPESAPELSPVETLVVDAENTSPQITGMQDIFAPISVTQDTPLAVESTTPLAPMPDMSIPAPTSLEERIGSLVPDMTFLEEESASSDEGMLASTPEVGVSDHASSQKTSLQQQIEAYAQAQTASSPDPEIAEENTVIGNDEEVNLDQPNIIPDIVPTDTERPTSSVSTAERVPVGMQGYVPVARNPEPAPPDAQQYETTTPIAPAMENIPEPIIYEDPVRRSYTWILVSLIALMLIGGGVFAFITFGDQLPFLNRSAHNTLATSPVGQDGTDTLLVETFSGQDCGVDLHCFQDLAQTCTPARVFHAITYPQTIRGVSAQVSLLTEYRIRNEQEEGCFLDMNRIEHEIALPADFIQSERARGSADADILERINALAQLEIEYRGLVDSCRFEREQDFVAFIEREKNNAPFSLAGAVCTGSLLTQSS
ncbi:MAG: hypothetical protein LRY41_03595 [Candidatus Pacebacteria bacterium]|nr:hypothetical protein [Candidatus Paceibacterota bacterium]MCD8508361.1 hypothetical protein [Candidatus Paceibacterota bacterium]MCD8528374.1 hypothetical protein [Candidatus Paceibacterota bacterium]MCD8563673.1 hypothetical protein [Candidatus Paceibacterota bacterium]